MTVRDLSKHPVARLDSRADDGSVPLKVVFIAGTGRCGSTLVENLLAQVSGLSTTGELLYLWDRGLQQNRKCSCGMMFRECELWSGVLRGMQIEGDSLYADSVREKYHKIRNLHLALGLLLPISGVLQRRAAILGEELEKTLKAFRTSSACEVVVDSSKSPNHGVGLSHIKEIDLRVVHLVRDPRAVIFSGMTTKYDPGKEGLMTKRGIFSQILQYWLWNMLIVRYLKSNGSDYKLLRYEDFVENPSAVLDSLINFIGERNPRLPPIKGRQAKLILTHGVSGNPIRMNHGAVEIRRDARWETSMRPLAKLVVTFLCFPMLLRYGYPLFGR